MLNWGVYGLSCVNSGECSFQFLLVRFIDSEKVSTRVSRLTYYDYLPQIVVASVRTSGAITLHYRVRYEIKMRIAMERFERKAAVYLKLMKIQVEDTRPRDARLGRPHG